MIAAIGADSAELLAAVHARAFEKPWSAADIARLLETPSAFAIVSQESEPQGFVLAWAPAPDAEILTLAVTPEARRRGVGSALVNAAGAAALMRGAASLSLDVADDNTAARALYAKLGFAEVARRNAYYERASGRVDALILRRALPRPPI